MKVILVNTDFMHDTERPIQPLTMYTIAGIITPYVEEVEVIEPMKYRLFPENGKLVDVLIAKSKKASLIAFTANSFSWAEILKITLAIRENNKQVKIVVGGIHVSYFYREILKENPQISFAFTGEAEKSFPQLIKYLNGEIPIENVPNLHYMRNGRLVSNKKAKLVDFQNEDIPFPRYDLVEEDFFDRFTFEASRGCEGNCRFCSVLYKRCWRRFSQEIVLERLEMFKQHLDLKCKKKDFIFTDDCFTTDSKWANDVLKGMLNRGFKEYKFLIEARAKNLWDENLLETITDFQDLHIQIGIESGYDLGLEKINKEVRIADIVKTAKLLEKYNIARNVFTSFIIGFPWETKEECMKTIRFAAYLNDEFGMSVNVAWWMPLPSNLFAKYFKDKSIFVDDDFSTKKEIFYKAHPNITYNDTLCIDICDSLYKNMGICWRL